MILQIFPAQVIDGIAPDNLLAHKDKVDLKFSSDLSGQINLPNEILSNAGFPAFLFLL